MSKLLGHERREEEPNYFGTSRLGTGRLLLLTCSEPRSKISSLSSKFISLLCADSTSRLMLDFDDDLASRTKASSQDCSLNHHYALRSTPIWQQRRLSHDVWSTSATRIVHARTRLRGELRNADETWEHRRKVMGNLENTVRKRLSKSCCWILEFRTGLRRLVWQASTAQGASLPTALTRALWEIEHMSSDRSGSVFWTSSLMTYSTLFSDTSQRSCFASHGMPWVLMGSVVK